MLKLIIPPFTRYRRISQESPVTEESSTLNGKVALITGGAHRIGAAIAEILHAAGMNLVVHYRNSRRGAEDLKRSLESRRPESVRLVQGDLLQTDTLPAIVDSACRWRGRLDLLVNNASSFYPTPVPDANLQQWEDLMGSNLRAPFFLAKAAATSLRESAGAIINLVDIHAERPLKLHPIYSMAKAGNAMMVKSLARELGPEIRVNGVAPGAILWPEQGMTEETKQIILERTALRRAGTPQDIARTVLFLARDADYITGQIIAVDGGRTTQH